VKLEGGLVRAASKPKQASTNTYTNTKKNY